MLSNHASEICQKIGTVLCITSLVMISNLLSAWIITFFVRNKEAFKIISINRIFLILQKPEESSLLSLEIS
jgi:hypothetical protein